jgi:hypothetical protein
MLTLQFAFSNIPTGHMFNYAKREGIYMCSPDLRHHSEESPTVDLEQGIVSGRSSRRLSETAETNRRCRFDIGYRLLVVVRYPGERRR